MNGGRKRWYRIAGERPGGGSSVPPRREAFLEPTLLVTKLYAPRARPGLVARPRLQERLERGLTRRLTLVSAPAGYGKTTLLGQWLAALRSSPARSRTAWLSLDREDNDPERFLGYLAAALDIVLPGAVRTLPHPRKSVSISTILTSLVNAAAAFHAETVLVLDDYHCVVERSVHEAVAFLLEHLPERLHLVVSARGDPPLPLARLRARDELVELRAADLRFTPEETALFLRGAAETTLEPSDAAALASRTEGWIAGLRLAAAALRDRGDVRGFMSDFSGGHRYVFDYLAEEVLARQPDTAREFLRTTSVLDRLCGPLCDALTGRSDGAAELDRLERSNLFTVALDARRSWFRYHALFADFLRSGLTVEETRALHRRASAWHARNGFPGEAIRHASAAGDDEGAALLIEGEARAALTRGETATLRSWLESLPPELVRSRPRLCLANAWTALAAGRSEDVEPWLRGAASAAPEDRRLAAEADTVRAFIAVFKGDTGAAVALSRAALENLDEGDAFLRGFAAENLGLAHDARGDTAEAEEAHGRARALALQAGNRLLAVMAAGQLADLKMLRGRLREAARLFERAVREASAPDALSPVAPMIYGGLARVLYEWNDLAGAERRLAEALQFSRQSENADSLAACFVLLARLRQAQGDEPGARDLIRRSERAMAGGVISPPTEATARAYAARVFIRQGDLKAAEALLENPSNRAAGDSGYPGYLLQLEGATRARLLIAAGRPAEAERELFRLIKTAAPAGRTGETIEILTLRALALDARGLSARALPPLLRALTLAEPEGYVRLFADEGAPLAALLSRAQLDVRKKPRPGRRKLLSYIRRLQAACGGKLAPVPPDGAAPPEGLIEPLSARETEVLGLVATGFSNAEIGEKLFISLGTVKRHINNIFAKLDVRSRTQAVARAVNLGILKSH